MPAVADYVVVADNKFSLSIGGDIDRDFAFSLPNTTQVSGSGILQLMQDAVDPDGLRFRVEINGTEILTWTTSTALSRGIHETFGGNILQIGANTMRFVVESGDGTLECSDVVVWYQNNA
jgi:hypothetical protein